jgi:serine/threonine protein kinase
MPTFLPDGREIIRIHPTKEIYVLRDDPNVLIKIMEDPMTPAIQNEIDLQIEAAKLGVAPKLYKHYVHNGKVYIEMEKLEGMSLADMYGDAPEDLPDSIWAQVHDIVRRLYLNGIDYIDLTAYNFIVDNDDTVRVIDFGHAKKIHVNYFLKEFLQGAKEWNPDFR